MSIEGELKNYPLLDVIAILSHRGESGRLQIDVGSAPGALYFKRGELVDARIGSLRGFAAVNLAVSIEHAHFCFESTVNPPDSVFKNPNEKLLLARLLGIETLSNGADLEATCDKEEATRSV